MRLFTARYFAQDVLTSGAVVPVFISVSPPVIPLPYEVVRGPESLLPDHWSLGEWRELSRAYWSKLDALGVERIAGELAEISEHHGGLPLALLCYEDLLKGDLCYRAVFSEWWEHHTGEQVLELLEGGGRRHHTTLHRRLKVKRPKVWTEDRRYRPVKLTGWPISHQQLAEWLDTRYWQFARTTPQNPHEYTHRRWGDPESFERAVLHIREHGRQESYAGREYIVYDCGPHFYWTMGDELATTVILNRKFHDPESQAQLAEEQTGKSREELGLGLMKQEKPAEPGLFDASARRENP